MDLSHSKLPWYVQIGAFVIVAAGAVFGFWKFYVTGIQSDIESRQTRLAALKTDVARGLSTARRLPEFQSQVSDLEHRLENLKAVLPEEKDVADILRRVQGLATQSNLTIQRFTPQPLKQQPLYAELPYRLQALASFPVNTWRESCHAFRYANDAVVAAGTYTGRVVYTLSVP